MTHLVLLEEASDPRVAFSHKRTLVQQRGNFSKGVEVDVHFTAALLLKTLDSFLEQLMVSCTGSHLSER